MNKTLENPPGEISFINPYIKLVKAYKKDKRISHSIMLYLLKILKDTPKSPKIDGYLQELTCFYASQHHPPYNECVDGLKNGINSVTESLKSFFSLKSSQSKAKKLVEISHLYEVLYQIDFDERNKLSYEEGLETLRKEACKLDPLIQLPPIIFKFNISVMDMKYKSNVSTPEPVEDRKKPIATIENKRLSCSLTGIDITASNDSIYSNDSNKTTPTNNNSSAMPHIRCSSLQIEDLKIKHSESVGSGDSDDKHHHHHHRKKNYPLSTQIQSSTSDMIVSSSKNRNRSKSGRDVEVKTEPSHLKLQPNKNTITRSISNPNAIEEMYKKRSDESSPMTTSSNSDFLIDPLVGSMNSDSPLMIDPLEDPLKEKKEEEEKDEDDDEDNSLLDPLASNSNSNEGDKSNTLLLDPLAGGNSTIKDGTFLPSDIQDPIKSSSSSTFESTYNPSDINLDKPENIPSTVLEDSEEFQIPTDPLASQSPALLYASKAIKSDEPSPPSLIHSDKSSKLPPPIPEDSSSSSDNMIFLPSSASSTIEVPFSDPLSTQHPPSYDSTFVPDDIKQQIKSSKDNNNNNNEDEEEYKIPNPELEDRVTSKIISPSLKPRNIVNINIGLSIDHDNVIRILNYINNKIVRDDIIRMYETALQFERDNNPSVQSYYRSMKDLLDSMIETAPIVKRYELNGLSSQIKNKISRLSKLS